MPMYEYTCGGCGHVVEEIVPVKGPHPRKCPECKKLKLKKNPVPSKAAQLHMRYSPMHPRAMRGQRSR